MKPMLCNTQVVQNILAGRQTQDRRPIKPQPIGVIHEDEGKYQVVYFSDLAKFSKYQPGDILYVRETWQTNFYRDCKPSELDDNEQILYYASQSKAKQAMVAWRPNIHMPKKFARIFLKVTKVRVERIQDISWNDCKAEGISWVTKPGEGKTFKSEFERLWNSCYPSSWERNDWIFVYNFERIEKP